MRVIDLSCDLGEAESAHDRDVEASLWPLITSANIACGGHAGDRDSMEVAIRRASELGVVLGAHPSYPDRLHFGRVSLPIRGTALRDALIEQLEELCELSHDAGMQVSHVKPHGALYNDAHHDAELAGLVAETVRSVDAKLAMVAAAGSSLLSAAKDAGLHAIAEAFADRRYRSDGSLVPRSEPDALLLDPDEAVAQAMRFATESVALANDGHRITIPFATLCVHGDMPRSVERLTAIREGLEQSGCQISASARAL
jgi:UPF0271 protein